MWANSGVSRQQKHHCFHLAACRSWNSVTAVPVTFVTRWLHKQAGTEPGGKTHSSTFLDVQVHGKAWSFPWFESQEGQSQGLIATELSSWVICLHLPVDGPDLLGCGTKKVGHKSYREHPAADHDSSAVESGWNSQEVVADPKSKESGAEVTMWNPTLHGQKAGSSHIQLSKDSELHIKQEDAKRSVQVSHSLAIELFSHLLPRCIFFFAFKALRTWIASIRQKPHRKLSLWHPIHWPRNKAQLRDPLIPRTQAFVLWHHGERHGLGFLNVSFLLFLKVISLLYFMSTLQHVTTKMIYMLELILNDSGWVLFFIPWLLEFWGTVFSWLLSGKDNDGNCGRRFCSLSARRWQPVSLHKDHNAFSKQIDQLLLVAEAFWRLCFCRLVHVSRLCPGDL